jgi:hypothetical protein
LYVIDANQIEQNIGKDNWLFLMSQELPNIENYTIFNNIQHTTLLIVLPFIQENNKMLIKIEKYKYK